MVGENRYLKDISITYDMIINNIEWINKYLDLWSHDQTIINNL